MYIHRVNLCSFFLRFSFHIAGADIKSKLIYEKFIHYIFNDAGWKYKEKVILPESSTIMKSPEVINADNAWYQKSADYSSGEYFLK
jgi:hypothetical protein